jgi:tetratricopeptide (TPR) repeat protein
MGTMMHSMRPALLFALCLAPIAARAQSNPSVERGRELFDARRYDEARAALAPAADDDPQVAYYRGRIALVEGNAVEAVRWLERAVGRDGERADYRLWLSRAYGREALDAGFGRRISLARHVKNTLERAIQLDPENTDARQELLRFYLVAPGFMGGSSRKAREQADAIARTNPLRGRIARGAIAEADDRDADAEREYRAAIESAPDSAAAYYALAAFYQRTKQYDNAFATYDQLLRVAPAETEVHYQLGRTAALSGKRLDDAERSLRTFLERLPDGGGSSLASAHLRLAEVYERGKRFDLARREYEIALGLDPRRKEARTGLSRMRDADVKM